MFGLFGEWVQRCAQGRFHLISAHVSTSLQVGCYHHLVKNGYMTQTRKNFGFAAKPQIKSWQRADDNALSDSDSDDSDVKVDDQALDDAEDILDLCT